MGRSDEVVPQPGGVIRLGASLNDYDTFTGNDGVGDEVFVAPFETGWRRDVSLLLTGDGARINVAFHIEPI